MRFDLASSIDLKPGTGILDTQGAAAHVLLIAATAGPGTVALEHGNAADLSDAEAVPAADLNGTLTQAGFAGAGLRKLGYIGNRRYVRATITGGTATAMWLRGRLESAPAPNPPG